MTRPSVEGSPIETLHVSGLTYGPHAIGRLRGKAIFVRGALPGEDVEVRVREDHGSYAYADAVTVTRAAPERRVPPCPYLPTCGGCPWQHVSYPAQLRAKEQNVRDHLTRTAGLGEIEVLPILGSPDEFGYRSRLSLRTENRRVGFYAGGSHELVAVDHCLLATEPVDAAIQAAAGLVRQLSTHIRRVEIVERGRAGVVLLGEAEGTFDLRDGARIERWLLERGASTTPLQPSPRAGRATEWPCTELGGVILEGKRWRHVWGDERISFSPQVDLTLTARGGVFTQVNPAANRLLVRTVLEMGAFTAVDRVLDLYAGAGNLTVPIARCARAVVAVEQRRLAAEDAVANAVAAGVTNCRVITAPAHVALESLRSETFDALVIDPPRSGAAEILGALLAKRPKRFIYVSCNPATLARDLRQLARRYRIEAVRPIDLFPQSYHVEAVTLLTC